MKKLAVVLCACLALGLVAAGCGGDDDDTGDNGGGATVERTETETATTETEATDTEAAGEQVAIEIVDIDYDPREQTLPAGSTVTWTNTGDLPHTVTKQEGPGGDFDSGTLEPGDTFEQTFDTPGEIAYQCTIHPQQQGSLTVE